MKHQKRQEKKVFKTRDARALSEKDAPIVGRALEELALKLGREVQAADVVEASKAKSSPLHRFIWTKSEADAAMQWRLWRARNLMTSVTYEIRGATVPAFVNIRDGRGYVPTKIAYDNKDTVEKFTELALRDLMAWLERYSNLRKAAGLAPVFAAIEKVIASQKAA